MQRYCAGKELVLYWCCTHAVRYSTASLLALPGQPGWQLNTLCDPCCLLLSQAARQIWAARQTAHTRVFARSGGGQAIACLGCRRALVELLPPAHEFIWTRLVARPIDGISPPLFGIVGLWAFPRV